MSQKSPNYDSQISPASLGLSSDIAWPELNAVSQQDELVLVEMVVPEDLPYFEGHFVDQPVLPGVVQIHWAAELALHFFETEQFVSAPSVKFNSMVLPGVHISLELKFNQVKQTVRFSYSGGDTKYSSGSLQFAGK